MSLKFQKDGYLLISPPKTNICLWWIICPFADYHRRCNPQAGESLALCNLTTASSPSTQGVPGNYIQMASFAHRISNVVISPPTLHFVSLVKLVSTSCLLPHAFSQTGCEQWASIWRVFLPEALCRSEPLFCFLCAKSLTFTLPIYWTWKFAIRLLNVFGVT